MKKNTLLLIVTTISGFLQNLISNGSFDDESDWTIVHHYV